MPGSSDSAKVVARQVDEHHVLGALLAIGEQVPREVIVGSGRGAARSRAGDGMGKEVARFDPEEEFRAGADYLELRHANEEEVWAWADAT